MRNPGINGEGELRGNRLTEVQLEKWPLKWSVCACVYFIHFLYSARQDSLLEIFVGPSHNSGKSLASRLVDRLPRWLSGLRHSAHRPERSAGGGRIQSPGLPVDFVFGFQGRML